MSRRRLHRIPAFGAKWDDLCITCHGLNATIQEAEGGLWVGGEQLAYAVQIVLGLEFGDHCCTARVIAASACAGWMYGAIVRGLHGIHCSETQTVGLWISGMLAGKGKQAPFWTMANT